METYTREISLEQVFFMDYSILDTVVLVESCNHCLIYHVINLNPGKIQQRSRWSEMQKSFCNFSASKVKTEYGYNLCNENYYQNSYTAKFIS